jgi:CO/xanthine dehydrogenase Mo-binding subunit
MRALGGFMTVYAIESFMDELGAGEAARGPVAAAIANALFDTIGYVFETSR